MQINKALESGNTLGAGVSKSGSVMGLGESLGELKFSLDGLKEDELNQTSNKEILRQHSG